MWNWLKRLFGIDTGSGVDKIIVRQFKNEIAKIDKELQKSVEHTPIGYGEVSYSYGSKDMADALADYYSNRGYKVDKHKSKIYNDHWNLTIKVNGWYE